MSRARVYVLATVGIVALASFSLWLVPNAVRSADPESRDDGLPLHMSFKQAVAQVDSAVQAYGQGIATGDVALARSVCDTSDTPWLAEQQRIVADVNARLAGHPARIVFPRTASYSIVHWGRPDSVASSIHGNALVIQDSLTGQVVYEAPYRALARYGRFRLVRPPEDEEAQVGYRLDLGRLYDREMGKPDHALEIWRQILVDFPQAEAEQRLRVHDAIAELLEKQKDFAGAATAWEQALGLDTTPHSYSSIQLDGKWVRVTQAERLKLGLARCTLAAGQKERARPLFQELAGSETSELAAAAKAALAGM
ncbi:MAG: hypothetical protein WDA75_10895 [Candidatus Latescibacterota bacterium]|jgi:tetratricopeptide (TPR) repeat protein